MTRSRDTFSKGMISLTSYKFPSYLPANHFAVVLLLGKYKSGW